MGIGWLTGNNEFPKIQFNAAIERSPSSTKAEATALLTAIITASPNTYLNIFLDSTCAIAAYNKVVEDEYTILKHTYKKSNYNIWFIIKYIKEQLNLKITLIKVKGHSNNILNDQANFLAKAGNSRPLLTFNTTSNIKINFVYDRQLIDTPINKLWKETFNAIQFNHFLDLKRNEATKQLTHNNVIDWKYVLKTFHFNANNEQSTNFLQSKMTAFKTHIFFKELPTIKHLSHKNHVLYQDVKCPSCGIIDEDQQHLWLCQSRSHTINNIKQKFITTLVEQSAIINERQQIDAEKIEIMINSYGFINII